MAFLQFASGLLRQQLEASGASISGGGEQGTAASLLVDVELGQIDTTAPQQSLAGPSSGAGTSAGAAGTSAGPSGTSSSEAAQADGDGSTEEESAASVAARTRLATVDIQNAITYIEEHFPYVLLLLGIFVINRCLEVIQIIWLLAVLLRGNTLVKQQVASRDRFNPSAVLAGLVHVGGMSFTCLFVSNSLGMLRYLAFLPPAETKSLVDIVLTVAVVDSLARVASLCLKLLLVLGYQGSWAARSRIAGATSRAQRHTDRLLATAEGHWLGLLEALTRLYRLALPIPLYNGYLLTATGMPALCSMLLGCYFTLKATSAGKAAKLLWVSGKGALSGGGTVGAPIKEDPGCTCPVCFSPCEPGAALRLPCSHVFCDSCIGEWLERNRTCPMCRVEVQAAPLKGSGSDGSTPLAPSFF